MVNSNPNTKPMIMYAKQKTEVAKEKVNTAFKKMIKEQRRINFNSISEESGVSKGFLYKNIEIRERIEMLRKQEEGLSSPKKLKRTMNNNSKDVLIESLKNKIMKLEIENEKLKKQLQSNLSKFYNEI